jgi:hypothetical protein
VRCVSVAATATGYSIIAPLGKRVRRAE